MVNKKRLVKTFCDLAKIKSPSGKEEKIAKILIEKLKKLGLAVRRDKHGNIVGRLAGDGAPLILCAHIDTVAVGAGDKIRPLIKGGKIFSDGKTILGADNKDSIAAILELLTILKENKLKHRALEIVFTKEEEAISRGARELDLSLLKGRECVISDHANVYGTIVTGAPGCYQFEARVFGKRCHVKEPEKGVNAVAIVAEAIRTMPLGRIDQFTTSNVAYQVSGLQGAADDLDAPIGRLFKENRNTVPDFSVVLGEVRSTKAANLKRSLLKIKKAFENVAKKFGGKINFVEKKLTDGYVLKKNNPLIFDVQKIFRAQNVKSILRHAVGGSDANVLNNRGINTVVIASAHRNNHQCSEYLIIDDLVKLAEFYLLMVRK